MSDVETIQKFIQCQRLAEDIGGRISIGNHIHLHRFHGINNIYWDTLDEVIKFLQHEKDIMDANWNIMINGKSQ